MKTVLITGASSGIGYEAALAFAKKGFQVIATMRNLEKQKLLKETALNEKLPIDVQQLDVTNDQSVQNIVNYVLSKYKHLDILINNAGAGFLGALEQTSLEDAKNVMEVNFFGVWRLTQAILPIMRKRKSGHIISLSSVGGVIGQPFNDAYCAAKFAVEGMMESLAPVVKRFGIQVSLVEPGPVHSEFVSSVINRSPTLTAELHDDYKPMLDKYFEGSKAVFANMGQKSQEVANILLEIAAAEQAQFRYQTSPLSTQLVSAKFVDKTGNQTIDMIANRI